MVDPSQSSSSSSTHRPLSRYVSYEQLSPKYQNFACAIATVVEPMTYEHAVLDLNWQEAMDVELTTLEQNNNWTLMPLPSVIVQSAVNGCTRLSITRMAQLRDTKPDWSQKASLNEKGLTIRKHLHLWPS